MEWLTDHRNSRCQDGKGPEVTYDGQVRHPAVVKSSPSLVTHSSFLSRSARYVPLHSTYSRLVGTR